MLLTAIVDTSSSYMNCRTRDSDGPTGQFELHLPPPSYDPPPILLLLQPVQCGGVSREWLRAHLRSEHLPIPG